jgi:hypothetical protein
MYELEAATIDHPTGKKWSFSDKPTDNLRRIKARGKEFSWPSKEDSTPSEEIGKRKYLNLALYSSSQFVVSISHLSSSL